MTAASVCSTRLTRLLDITHPVLNAPMGDTAGGRLAAAVTEGGGLGLIGGGYGNSDWLERELRLVAGARFGVGFITFALHADDRALRLALDAGPTVLQLSFGDPTPFARHVRGAGALLACGVTTTAEVDRAVAAGAEILVAQGSDAGGHGQPGPATLAVVASVREHAPDVAVVAAGGVSGGRGLVAALAAGADGVSMGTRFLATPEALTTDPELDAVLRATAGDTVRTDIFDLVRGPAWPDGHDGRVVRNDLVDRWEAGSDLTELSEIYERSTSIDTAVQPVWAGESAGGIHDILPASEAVRRTASDAIERIQHLQSLLRSCSATEDPS